MTPSLNTALLARLGVASPDALRLVDTFPAPTDQVARGRGGRDLIVALATAGLWQPLGQGDRDIAMRPVNEPTFVATTEYDGDFVELGTGAADDEVGAVCIQFAPTIDFVGEFIVMGRNRKSPAQSVTAPFLPIPYIRVNVANVASDRAISSATITTTGMIEVPANGLSVAVLMSCSAGSCTLYLTRLAGTPGSL